MQKGQVSFDLILAIIVALIFIGGIQLLNTQMQQMQKESAVKIQERAIALNLYRAIASAHALRDGYMEVNYKTERLIVPEESALQPCTIDLDSENIASQATQMQITAGYSLDGDMVDWQTSSFNDSGLDVPAQLGCGDTIAITKST
jgi:hypothetical protein